MANKGHLCRLYVGVYLPCLASTSLKCPHVSVTTTISFEGTCLQCVSAISDPTLKILLHGNEALSEEQNFNIIMPSTISLPNCVLIWLV